MTFNTIGGKVPPDMVWIACSSIIILVAVYAFTPQRLKPEE
jgi:hypothetical protein